MNDRKEIELDITDLAFDGKAVGHIDGKVIFCDGGLPGERVRIKITRTKPRFANARVEEILTRCDDRIDPVCEHDHQCGGCTWQDLKYERQLQCKQEQVAACLKHIGGLDHIEVADIVPAAKQFYYRNKMEFSFHLTEDGESRLGLHRRGHFDDIFDIHHCHLQSEFSNKVVKAVRDFTAEKEIPVYNVHDHSGYLRFLVVREAKRTGQNLINLVTARGELPNKDEFVAMLCEQFPEITTIVHNETGSKANIAVGESETILFGDGSIEEEVCGLRFRIMANSFFQTNSDQAEVLYNIGFDLLKPEVGERLLDLYCGTGTIGIIAASRVAEVVGAELVTDAIRVARENATANNVENISFFEGNVKDLLKQDEFLSGGFDSIIIDPPRAGLHPKALRRMLRLNPGKILYISCNPATFARDAKEIIDQKYSIDSVTPVDMFPHTKHIELVGLFTRTNG